MNKNIELLAPAGSLEALKAAVQAGCDAVYLGGANFGARAYAKNFDENEILKAIEYCHLRDIKLYVTVNTLLKDEEIEDALNYAAFLYRAGVDAIIVQDLGFANLLKKKFPDFDLHASTQMTIYDLNGAKFAKEMGIKRVILARETKLSEIEKINTNTDLEIEAFAHGALCVSYSGQCLLSSMIGGRSGNRGRCAQPCRKPYTILDSTKKILTDEKYFLSPRDLALGNNLNAYIEKGIDSIKIEGRMKRPEYVYQAVKTYRNIIDGNKNQKDMEELKSIFNRSFTKGLPLKDFANDYINTKRPNNQGIEAAKILSKKKNGLEILALKDLNHKDTIELEKNGEPYVFTFPRDLKKGEKFLWHIKFKPDSNSIRRIVDIDLIDSINKKLEKDRFLIPINFEIELRIGNKPKLKAVAKGKMIEIIGKDIIERAKNRPITEENIQEQLSKTKDSIFYLDDLKIFMDEDIFMPLKTLNALRREALEELEKTISNKYSQRISKDPIVIARKSIKRNAKTISVEILNSDIFKKLPLNNIQRIYFKYLNNLESDIIKAKERNIECVISTENIATESEYSKLEEISEKYDLAIEAESLSSAKRFENYRLYAGMGMNVFNSQTAEFLKQKSFNSALISPELGIDEIRNFKTKLDLEYMVYGFIPGMTLEYCVASAIKNCKDGEHCENCNFKNIYIKDELGVDFPIIRNNNISKIYNAYPIFLIDRINEMKNYLNSIRLKFIDKDEMIIDLITISRKILEGETVNRELEIVKSKLKRDYQNITVGRYLKSAE
ncbi:MAG: U32 family peptidase [Tissierellia bacterium]|nr:U32 family peptidase [Tissierellia bacterium]